MNAEIPTEDPLTTRTRTIWTAGDFGEVAKGYAVGAAHFVERLSLDPGSAVLDVACGSGNLSIPAARLGAAVTGVDIAPYLVAVAQREAAAAGVAASFEVGDAEALPYSDGSFDVTMTMFGAMFAPHPDRAAAELVRVTRRGGTVAMANWIPSGFIGQMLRAHVALVPPPPGLASPLGWGDPATVKERFGGRLRTLECTPRLIAFRYPMPPREVVSLFANSYGPTIMTLRALDHTGREALIAGLNTLWAESNVATDGSTLVWSEYLEVLGQVA